MRAIGASIKMAGGAIPHMERGARNVTRRTAEDILDGLPAAACEMQNGDGRTFCCGERRAAPSKMEGDRRQICKTYELYRENLHEKEKIAQKACKMKRVCI